MLYTKDRYLIKIKHYSNSLQYTLFKYNPNLKSFKRNSSSKDEVNRCSVSRSISLIKEYALCNSFDFFVTLTLKDFNFRCDEILACEYFNHKIKEYSKLVRRKGKEFKYIYVFERQKKGGIHLHGYFSGFIDLYTNENGYLSSLFFDNLGFQNFTIAHDVNPFYLIKYISKEPIKIKHIFYRSKGLKKADISYLHDDFSTFSNFPFTFENQFCKIITVENNSTSENIT